LVDGLTASAAEIISAALRDDIGAKLVGTKTFGKCTVQTMKEFDD
jgi:carboxyl-terminal processing protease